MKKKFIALIMSLCLLFSVFSGCSLIKHDPAYADNTVIATLYGQNITYKDLKEKYEAYSQYFAYYDQDVVMNVIYDELYLEALQKSKSNNLVVLTNDEVDEILEDLYHEYVHLTNSQEQILLEFYGKTVPERITNHSDSDDTENNTFSEYEFEPKTPVDFSSVTPAENVNLASKVSDLMAEIYEDVTTEEKEIRDEAWDRVLADLVYDYKMNGKTLTKNEALLADLEERFESLKTAEVLKKYREYVESTVFGATTYGATDQLQLAGQLNDPAVASKLVNKYKEILNKNKQVANSKENYTELLFSTKNTDIILYHYYDSEMQTENVKFFSVLHLLVSFDADTKAELNQYVGSTDSKDAMFREEYETARMAKAWDGSKWIVSSTYRDSDGNTVQTEKLDSENNIVYEKDSEGEYKLDEDGNKIPVMVDATITMQEIYDKFEAEWAQYLSENPTLTEAEKSHKRTELFRKYMFLYTDSQEYSNLNSDTMVDLMGYSLSNEENENAGLMKEFADTAKHLYSNYANGTYALGEEIDFAVTSYGVHMMILNNVYTPGEIVSLTKEVGGETVEKTDAEIIEDMKNVVISTYKGQTLLEYIYEQTLTSELSNFYSTELYKVLNQAEVDGQFVKLKTPTYTDLRTY